MANIKRQAWFGEFLRRRSAVRFLPEDKMLSSLRASYGAQSQGDVYGAIGVGRRRAVMPAFVNAQISANRLADWTDRRDALRSTTKDLRESAYRKNQMWLPIWLVAAVMVFRLELALGTWLVSALAPEDGPSLVQAARIALATVIFVVGHLIAHSVSAFAKKRFDRRAGVELGLGVLYLTLLASGLIAVEAELNRWVMTFAAVIGAVAVAFMKPSPDVARHAGHALITVGSTGVVGFLRGRARRRFMVFERRLLRQMTKWLQRTTIRVAVEAEYGGDAVNIDGGLETAELDRMASIGVAPSRNKIEALVEMLTRCGIDPGGPDDPDDRGDADVFIELTANSDIFDEAGV